MHFLFIGKNIKNIAMTFEEWEGIDTERKAS